jgi:hypothetical protein
MHRFASVFMWFYCVFTAKTYTSSTFHMYTKIHMYHIFYMKCTVLLVFSCVFTVFSLQKHVLLVHFKCIPKYTCTIYSTWNALFCQWVYVFSMCFHWRNMYFWYILHIYIKIHMYHIFYMNCTVLLLGSCAFTVFSLQKHVLLVHFTWVFQNTHIPYILHEMHSFASVFMCFHCVFTAETCTFGTFHINLPKKTCTIYSTSNAQFC